MIWVIIAMIGIAWTLQGVLGYFQIENFNIHFKKMRKLGRVLIGKEKGKLKLGTIVLICIDKNCNILKIERMHGISVFARMRILKGLENKDILKLNNYDFNGFDKYTVRAIKDAINTFKNLAHERGDKLSIGM